MAAPSVRQLQQEAKINQSFSDAFHYCIDILKNKGVQSYQQIFRINRNNRMIMIIVTMNWDKIIIFIQIISSIQQDQFRVFLVILILQMILVIYHSKLIIRRIKIHQVICQVLRHLHWQLLLRLLVPQHLEPLMVFLNLLITALIEKKLSNHCLDFKGRREKKQIMTLAVQLAKVKMIKIKKSIYLITHFSYSSIFV